LSDWENVEGIDVPYIEQNIPKEVTEGTPEMQHLFRNH